MWASKQGDIRRLKASVMEMMRRRAGCSSLERSRNDVLEERKVDPVEKKLVQYKQEWLNHVSRMEGIRYPKQLHDYEPIGRRRS
jgi:uncharacterized protein (DUF2252 family)